MLKMIKNLRPYKAAVLATLIMLFVQAYCDISLPQYTQDIIDVGIQNQGIEHILPTRMTADEYEEVQIFMDEEQRDTWQDAYEQDGDQYELTVTDEDELDSLDSELLKPIVMTYQLGHMTEDQLRETMKQQLNGQMPLTEEQIDAMSIEDFEAMMHIDLPTFEAENEEGETVTYVDMRPFMQQMIASGQMSASQMAASEDQLDEIIDSIGEETLQASGVAYAADAMDAAGVDVDQIQKDYLYDCALRMIGMTLLMALAACVASFLSARIGASIGKDLRGRVFHQVLSYSNTEIKKFETSSLITRATNDIQQVQMVTTMMLVIVMYSPILAIWGIYRVVQTHANMNWLIVLGVASLMTFILLLMVIALPKFRIMQKLVDALNGVSREILTGLPVIRAFNREKTEEERFDEANTDLMKTQLFTNRVMTFMSPVMMILMNALILLITWVAAHRIDDGRLQVGEMTAFITYTMMIVMSFMMLSMMSIILPRAGVAAERIDEILSTESSITDRPEALDYHPSNEGETRTGGEIVFDHVDFAYPDAEENVLSDISFTAKPGETTAIIGSTGSGKSTLVNLIPRFFDVTGGRILLDGHDIRDITLHSLRENIGFVPQKGVLFSGTIASNLRFGNKEASLEEMKEAADVAQARDFIEEKKDQYDTYIAEGGSNVSGGQKQRLSIARALAKKPRVLVFDDSFSALDMKTDAALRQRLAEKEKGITKIIVAQRVSTILHAEQILVLDEGELVGKGTHEELMENCDIYRQIAELQLSNSNMEG